MTCKVEGEAADGAEVRVAVEEVAWVGAAEQDWAAVLSPEQAALEWEGRACVPSAADDRIISQLCRVWNCAVPSAEPRWSGKARRITRKSSAVARRAPTKASSSWKRVTKGCLLYTSDAADDLQPV